MLIVKNLSIQNIQQNNLLVENLSFNLNENDKIAVIGAEGSGKSTLLKILYGEDVPYITYTGEVIRPAIISFVEQNLDLNWGTYTVYSYLVNEINDFDVYSYLGIISKLFNSFGLNFNQLEHRDINTLSGGEKVKISFIKAIMVKPDLLLLDEPSNDLDFETLLILEDLLSETSIPILFISHDQRFLENLSNGVIHLQQVNKKTKPITRFSKVGYSEYKDNYNNQYQKDLMISTKQRSDYSAKMEKYRRIYSQVEHQQNQAVRDPTLGRLLKKKIANLKSQEKRYEREKECFVDFPEREEPINLFFDTKTRINNDKMLLDLQLESMRLHNGVYTGPINLIIKGQEKKVIIGSNGIGKTTLIKLVEQELIKNNVNYAYISQNYSDVLDYDKKIVEFLLESQSKHGITTIRQILGSLGLRTSEMDYYIRDLSEGTKLKILLLIMISRDVDILLLDEPTRNISPLNQDELYNLFNSFEGAILAVSHDRAFIEETFSEIYELKKEGLVKS